MIKISDSFKTNDKKLAALYNGARRVIEDAVEEFGDYRLITQGAGSRRVSLATELMSAETLARYDTAAAMNCVRAFCFTQRSDGQLAAEIIKNGEDIVCDYSGLAGFSFIDEALSLYYMTKKKEKAYLDELYAALTRFDEFIEQTHDYNKNGLPEILSEKESAERRLSVRYAPIKISEDGKSREISVFPVETCLMAAFYYRLKIALGEMSSMVGDERHGIYFEEAEMIKARMKNFFFVPDVGACFDRDYRGSLMSALTIDNLFMMYCGALDRGVSDAFVKRHLMNGGEFFTKFPLPTYAANSPEFSNDPKYRFGGRSRGDSMRRAVKAMEKYGYFREFTHLAGAFIDSLAESPVFREHYDPFTGEASSGGDYAPTASAVLEIIARFYGVSVIFDEVHWGALGLEDESVSEYNLKWGGDMYTLAAEKDTSMGLINGSPIFTITNGARVITDWFGDSPKVVNITDETHDCVFVYRNQTFSFTISPGEIKEF